MKLIPGGNFIMGDSTGDADEQPTHKVLVHSFYMDETPVTYTDFKKYVADGGPVSRYWLYETYNRPDQPVTGLSWYHAVNFCNWRSALEGLEPAYTKADYNDKWGYPAWVFNPTSNGYRLPTEAEFEYAARGGLEQKPYPWGNEFNPEFANYDNERGVKKGDWWRLANVQSQKKNNYGLYNMSGNNWHWCHDNYDSTFYQRAEVFFNPLGPDTGHVKVIRGGSWGSISPKELSVSNRSYASPDHYNYDIGFRCVRPADTTITEKLQPDTSNAANFEFHTYTIPEVEDALKLDVFSDAFKIILAEYIHDRFPECLYFKEKIDGQEMLTPHKMANLIVDECREQGINPVFLTGIMTSESGFATCSFPRWYNNPMAYHWQNINMSKGLPTYNADKSHNRKYKDLRAAIRNYSKIKRKIYFDVARKDLYAFHKLYVGYEAKEWMYTLSKVYHDLLGVKIAPHFPEENIGKYIYSDW